MACILDASAVLAFLLEEPGNEVVADAISEGAGVCAGNLAEVVTVLVRYGMPAENARRMAAQLPVTCFDLDLGLAMHCGTMIVETRTAGLSLGDRMCLALAIREGLLALTADRAWSAIAPAIGATVRVIR